jgi:hypothetical protein
MHYSTKKQAQGIISLSYKNGAMKWYMYYFTLIYELKLKCIDEKRWLLSIEIPKDCLYNQNL